MMGDQLTDDEVEATVQALQVHHTSLRRKRARGTEPPAAAETTDRAIGHVFSAMTKMQTELARRDALGQERKAS